MKKCIEVKVFLHVPNFRKQCRLDLHLEGEAAEGDNLVE
jgi:hypothetical protein